MATKKSGKGEVEAVLAWLERNGKKKVRDGMARYAIPSDQAFGIAVGSLRAYAKSLGPDHDLAGGLWKTGYYEARMLAAFVGEPGRVTRAEMDRWCRDFDNWAICDTVCFHLWDRTPHALAKVRAWSGRKQEFEKRAAFALLASVALHDKQAPDAAFAKCLPLIERAAKDERNFVKKGVLWALRLVGLRSPELHVAASELARRLSVSQDACERWVGKAALRELSSPAAKKRLARRATKR